MRKDLLKILGGVFAIANIICWTALAFGAFQYEYSKGASGIAHADLEFAEIHPECDIPGCGVYHFPLEDIIETEPNDIWWGHEYLKKENSWTYTAITIQAGNKYVTIDWSSGVIDIIGDPNDYTEAARIFFESMVPQ